MTGTSASNVTDTQCALRGASATIRDPVAPPVHQRCKAGGLWPWLTGFGGSSPAEASSWSGAPTGAGASSAVNSLPHPRGLLRARCSVPHSDPANDRSLDGTECFAQEAAWLGAWRQLQPRQFVPPPERVGTEQLFPCKCRAVRAWSTECCARRWQSSGRALRTRPGRKRQPRSPGLTSYA